MVETAVNPEVFSGAAPLVMIVIFMIAGLFALAINILYVVAFCKIFSKAGYHWAMGLLMLVPIANIIMPLILGFGQWPILTQKQKIAD